MSKPLDLKDLVPRKAKFKLDDFPDKTFTLCRWSLRVRMHVSEKKTPKEIQAMFEKQDIVEIAKVAYYMLEEKEAFPTATTFFDSIATMQDQINIITALLETIGIGEPEIEAINAAMNPPKAEAEPTDPNAPSPNP